MWSSGRGGCCKMPTRQIHDCPVLSMCKDSIEDPDRDGKSIFRIFQKRCCLTVRNQSSAIHKSSTRPNLCLGPYARPEPQSGTESAAQRSHSLSVSSQGVDIETCFNTTSTSPAHLAQDSCAGSGCAASPTREHGQTASPTSAHPYAPRSPP